MTANERIQPHRKTGLLNCCIQTIRINPLHPTENESMICLFCRIKMRYRQGAWEFADLTDRERPNATTISN